MLSVVASGVEYEPDAGTGTESVVGRVVIDDLYPSVFPLLSTASQKSGVVHETEVKVFPGSMP